MKHIQRAWHAKPWACHASLMDQREEWSTHNGHGTPDPGRAMLVQLSKDEKKKEKGWACHLGSKAWHARPTPTLKKTLGVPLGLEGVARQGHKHMGRAT
ncbi:hypothetical protein AHAS_Ahas16G0180800 [Arachis hypogaea]